MEVNIENIRKEVESNIGQTVGTLYGPCLVIGIVSQEGKEFISLQEHGEEFVVALEDWHNLLQ